MGKRKTATIKSEVEFYVCPCFSQSKHPNLWRQILGSSMKVLWLIFFKVSQNFTIKEQVECYIPGLNSYVPSLHICLGLWKAEEFEGSNTDKFQGKN